MRRRVVESIGRSRSIAACIGALERLDRGRAGLLPILTYHQVEWPDADPMPYPRTTVTPEAFAGQMEHLASRYRPIALRELLAARRGERPLPRRAVMVTFDDAYRDFATQAWPVMRRLGIPATLFVPTAYPDEPRRWFWWECLHRAIHRTDRGSLELPGEALPLGTIAERDRAYDRLRALVGRLSHADAMEQVEGWCTELGVPPQAPAVLGWEALRQLAGEGVALASHTRTHPLLHRVPTTVIHEEAVGSQQDLEREIGEAPPVLAYPGGGINDEAVTSLARAGFELAFTTERGLCDLERTHPLRLRRINVGRRTTLSLLRAQLLSWSVYLNKPQHAESIGY